MHILDFIMYIIIGIIIYYISNKQYSNHIGGGVAIILYLFIYTLIYIICFALIDLNWIDIFRSINFDWISSIKFEL